MSHPALAHCLLARVGGGAEPCPEEGCTRAGGRHDGGAAVRRDLRGKERGRERLVGHEAGGPCSQMAEWAHCCSACVHDCFAPRWWDLCACGARVAFDLLCCSGEGARGKWAKSRVCASSPVGCASSLLLWLSAVCV
uniref:ORF6 n=1 Tax=Leishmania infantum TaxID=5671 RepID=Q25300_LEIIN|nr:ORF6 [Leishmania infantum]